MRTKPGFARSAVALVALSLPFTLGACANTSDATLPDFCDGPHGDVIPLDAIHGLELSSDECDLVGRRVTDGDAGAIIPARGEGVSVSYTTETGGGSIDIEHNSDGIVTVTTDADRMQGSTG